MTKDQPSSPVWPASAVCRQSSSRLECIHSCPWRPSDRRTPSLLKLALSLPPVFAGLKRKTRNGFDVKESYIVREHRMYWRVFICFWVAENTGLTEAASFWNIEDADQISLWKTNQYRICIWPLCRSRRRCLPDRPARWVWSRGTWWGRLQVKLNYWIHIFSVSQIKKNVVNVSLFFTAIFTVFFIG